MESYVHIYMELHYTHSYKELRLSGPWLDSFQTKNGKSGWLQYSVSPEAEELEDFFFIFRFFFLYLQPRKKGVSLGRLLPS